MNYRKYLFFTSAFLIYSIPVFSQNWEHLGDGVSRDVYSLYNDTIDNLLYIGGQFKYADGVNVNGVTKWDGQNFAPIGTGVNNCSNNYCQQTLAFIRYQDDIYCSPLSDFFGDTIMNGIAKWDGDEWNPVGEGIFSINGNSGIGLSTLTHNDELYIFGAFHRIGQDSGYYATKWDGISLTSLDFFRENLTSRIHHAVVFQDEIYVAGFFEDGFGNQLDVARYDGQNWFPVGGGIKGFSDDPAELIVYKNELYVCGNFKKTSGNSGTGIMKLKNDEWVDVGESFDGNTVSVRGMLIYDNSLYAFGRFDSVGGGVKADNIAKWDGEKWCGLGSTFTKTIIAGTVYDDHIYIGGSLDSINGEPFNKIAKWIGGSYVDTCGEATSTNNLIPLDVIISITPNPAQNILNLTIEGELSSNNSTVIFTNLLGQIVYQESTPSFDKKWQKQFDLSEYPNGIYFITIQNDSKIITKEFVIQR